MDYSYIFKVLVTMGLTLGQLVSFGEESCAGSGGSRFQLEESWNDKVTNTTPLLEVRGQSGASCGQLCEQLWRCRAFHLVQSSGLCLLYASRLVSSNSVASPGSRFFATRCPQAQDYNSVGTVQIRVVEESITWFQARRKCRQQHPCADLAKLHTATVINGVLNFIAQHGYVRQKNYLVGLQRTEPGHSTWVWLDGEPLVTSLWYPGQPESQTDMVSVTSRSSCDGNCLHDFDVARIADGFICQLFE